MTCFDHDQTIILMLFVCNCCFMQETFRKNYYDTTIEALKAMAFNSLHKCVLCAKCLECMIHLIRKVGRDNFRELEVVQVSTSSNSILN